MAILANRTILKEIDYFLNVFRNGLFVDLIDPSFINQVARFMSTLKRYFANFRINAIFVPNDISFFENLSINVCKQVDIPSFTFLHGLPGRYNNIDENRSDYLIVWGEKIKENYIKAGIDRSKIFVSGHPFYKELAHTSLRFSLDAPLIITKSMSGAQHSDAVVLADRGNSILYLYMVQKVLKKLGINHAKFRPHPSENSQWYLKFIDRNFYQPDHDDLQRSLREASAVIGPSSTVFLESLYSGTNYVCFEPAMNGLDLTNFRTVPPFDGSDERLPVARNEEELELIVKERVGVDLRIFGDYIKMPFDLSFVKSLV